METPDIIEFTQKRGGVIPLVVRVLDLFQKKGF